MSDRKHIAVVGATARSHVYPSLAIIRELVSRGHRVSYAIGEPLTDLVAATGAEVVPHPTILPQGDTPWPEDPAVAMRVFLDEAIAVLPRLTARWDEDRPDLVLYDIGGLPGPVLGTRYGVPAVQLSPTYVAWEGGDADLADVLEPIRTSPAGVAYHRTCTAWLREHGIDRDAWDWLGHPEHVLSLIPRAMQPHADRVPSHVRFVGPCLDPRRLTEEDWSPPRDGRRVLLVSFGSSYTEVPEVYRACLEGFADTDWQVVMAVGQRVDPAGLGPLPGNVEVHRVVPQLRVLAAASAFVTHAGMGGCTEALWFAVPTVAVPQAVDQFDNAARLMELGVGRRLDTAEVTAERLRAAVESVASSPEVAARLAALRAQVRAQGGVARATDAVEDFLA